VNSTQPATAPAQDGFGFPETAWSTILRARQNSPDERFAAVQRLCERYEPAIRRSFEKTAGPDMDVDELVQGFFTEKFLRPQFLANLERDGGRFRDFIRQCLRNYQRTAWRRSVRHSHHEVIGAEATEPTSEAPGPDVALDREWARQILELARARLRSEAEAGGLLELCSHLEAQLDGATDLPGQAELGQRLGKSPNAVAVALHRLRERYGWLLHDEIRQTVADPTRWREERDHLLAILNSVGTP
jgi:RNA polymerase sigma factor (sigma-70 family)